MINDDSISKGECTVNKEEYLKAVKIKLNSLYGKFGVINFNEKFHILIESFENLAKENNFVFHFFEAEDLVRFHFRKDNECVGFCVSRVQLSNRTLQEIYKEIENQLRHEYKLI